MKTTLLAFLCLLLSPQLHADDITDWIEDGLRAYRAGNMPEAIESLEVAAQMIRQLKGDEFSEALPEAPAGWTRTEAGGNAVGAALFGGATGANASYERSQGEEWSQVEIGIAADNPMLGAMLGALGNPMLMSGQGRKVIKIGGEKASLEYDAPGRSGEITVVVAQKVLVTVSGSGLSEEELRAFAAAVDYDRIRRTSSN
jgi:hypothetical protein